MQSSLSNFTPCVSRNVAGVGHRSRPCPPASVSSIRRSACRASSKIFQTVSGAASPNLASYTWPPSWFCGLYVLTGCRLMGGCSCARHQGQGCGPLPGRRFCGRSTSGRYVHSLPVCSCLTQPCRYTHMDACSLLGAHMHGIHPHEWRGEFYDPLRSSSAASIACPPFLPLSCCTA